MKFAIKQIIFATFFASQACVSQNFSGPKSYFCVQAFYQDPIFVYSES